jgi:ABC-2 type transport system permease protein
MDKLLVVIKREFMERIRSKWFLIITLLMPAFMAAIVLLPAWLAIRTSATNDLNPCSMPPTRALGKACSKT